MNKQQSTYFPDSFYRVTVKGLCVKDGKALLVREASDTLSGRWELPGGGLDFGEDIREGLKREIKEEMGLDVMAISEKPVYVWTHRYEKNRRNIGWYYSLVIVYKVEFENLDFTPSEECEAVDFFSKDELKKIQLNSQIEQFASIFNADDFK